MLEINSGSESLSGIREIKGVLEEGMHQLHVNYNKLEHQEEVIYIPFISGRSSKRVEGVVNVTLLFPENDIWMD